MPNAQTESQAAPSSKDTCSGAWVHTLLIQMVSSCGRLYEDHQPEIFLLPKEGQQRKAMETIAITYNFFKVPDWDKYTGTICAMMEVVRTKELENEFSVTRISRHSAGESPTALVSLFRCTCSLTYVLDGQSQWGGLGGVGGLFNMRKLCFVTQKNIIVEFALKDMHLYCKKDDMKILKVYNVIWW